MLFLRGPVLSSQGNQSAENLDISPLQTARGKCARRAGTPQVQVKEQAVPGAPENDAGRAVGRQAGGAERGLLVGRGARDPLRCPRAQGHTAP